MDQKAETVFKWFDINRYQRTNKYKSKKSALRALETCFRDCIERQMRCDVRWGCQLSGGIDSSLVTYYASGAADNPLRDTVSIVPSDERYSEEQYIEAVCDKVGLQSHNFSFSQDDILDYLEKTIYSMEGLLYHKSAIGKYKLNRFAKQYTTVLLAGEGADELMGGYVRFAQVYAKRNKPEYKDDYSFARMAVGGARLEQLTQITSKVLNFDKIMDYTKSIIDERINLFRSMKGSKFDQQIKYELQTYLVSLLELQDHMSMASSIEARVPILDNGMVEYAFSLSEKRLMTFRMSTLLHLPDIFKKKYATGGKPLLDGKAILKDKAKELFGEKFAYRTKMGMNIPCLDVVKTPEFRLYYEKVLRNAMDQRGIINVAWVEDKLNHIDELPKKEEDILWNSICFEIWCQLFIDGRKPLESIRAGDKEK